MCLMCIFFACLCACKMDSVVLCVCVFNLCNLYCVRCPLPFYALPPPHLPLYLYGSVARCSSNLDSMNAHPWPGHWLRDEYWLHLCRQPCACPLHLYTFLSFLRPECSPQAPESSSILAFPSWLNLWHFLVSHFCQTHMCKVIFH